MRIIKEKTLVDYCKQDKYKNAKTSLESWVKDINNAKWKSSNELKEKYKNASIIGNKRVIFNIKGNDYRLIVDIEYKINLVFIIWLGTHQEYDKINAKTIKHES